MREEGVGAIASDIQSRNLIVDYYDWLPEVVAHCGGDTAPVTEPGMFSPGFARPALAEDTRCFFDVGRAEWRTLAEHAGHRLFLLDLTRNPATNTTKTLASLLIIARAVEYIRR